MYIFHSVALFFLKLISNYNRGRHSSTNHVMEHVDGRVSSTAEAYYYHRNVEGISYFISDFIR